MRLLNKLIIIPVLLISWAGMAYADDSGLLFDWQPFVVKNNRELKQPWNNAFPDNLSAYKEMRQQYDYIDELFHSDVKTTNYSPDLNIKKSPLSNIKIIFSTVNSFMLPVDEISARGKDGKLSAAARTFPSLFRNPSQEITLETIKLIEPQINLGFEF